MKICKRIVSAVLIAAILITFPVFHPSVAQAAEENLPVIFIGGKGTYLIDKDGNQIFPRTFDFGGIVKEVLPELNKANITINYDEFGEELCRTVAEEYKDLTLDCNGVASNGSNTDFTWTKTELSWSVREDEPYRIYDYCFYYDWRTDPCEIADSLAKYIDDVLEVTGAPKVKIIGRCMGGNIVLAYLNEYGCDKVDRCLFYVTTINGTAPCGAAFAGDFQINRDAAVRFACDLGMDPVFTLGDDGLANELVASIVKLLRDTGGIDLAVAAVKNVYDRLDESVVPRLLLSTYATFPSYWSMVSDDYYEAAKALVFSGREDEYSGLISKIDNYHYNIQVKAGEILKRLESEGLDISVVCKYGVQLAPVCKEYDALSDNTVELSRSSFGATCKDLDEAFDDSYMAAAKAAGTEKYISPDRQVDCSTSLFRDYTWVIKNCTHSDFSKCIDELMMTIMDCPGRMSVNDNALYPQYLLYDKQTGTLTPLLEENCNTTERWEINTFEALFGAIKNSAILVSHAIAPKE